MKISGKAVPWVLVAILAGALAVSLGVNLFIHFAWVVPHARTFSADVRRTLGGYGAWAREHTPEGTPFAIPDIGFFAWVADRPVVDLAGLVTPAITPLIREFGNSEEGTLVTGLSFESAARPAYLIDRAARPRRLLDESPYAPCLEVIELPEVGEGRVRARGLRHPEAAYYTLYRIDWAAFDRMVLEERRAGVGGSTPGGQPAPGQVDCAQLAPAQVRIVSLRRQSFASCYVNASGEGRSAGV